MNNHKRLFSILLSAIMLASVSCGAEAGNTVTTASVPSAETSDTTAEDVQEGPASRDSVPSSISPDVSFSGETVTVLTRDGERYINEFYIEEETGDIMNDTVYQRNSKVMDQLGIDIAIISRPGDYGAHTKFANDVIKAVMAGDTAYDVISYYAYAMPIIAQQNVLYNLYDLEYLDLSKPWWHQKYIENAEVYGKLYSIAGDIALTTISFRYALFFNKALKTDYYEDTDLYQMVLDGKWTQEALINLTKDTYSDLNGNGKVDEEDFFGLDLNGALDPFPVGGNINYTMKTEDGGYVWDLFNEHNSTLIERFYDAYNNNPGIYFVDKTEETRFINGNSIFFPNWMFYTEKLRDMKDDYGILPMPKFDENQEQYLSLANDNFSLVAVPTICRNPGLVGAFLELMAEYSYKSVTPTYYEIAMKGKYLRDNQSCQMFDIIIDGAWYDFANINTSVLGDPVFITRQSQYHINKSNFASIWAKNEAKLTAALEKLLDCYKNN